MADQTQQTPQTTAVVSTPTTPSVGMFILFPAVAVLLGWGLRGYIGGGPFAAMIPGCYLALSLSLLLRHDRQQAVVTALFGTIAIGYGGEMTYGQTLGLARDATTLGWGMLGVTVKGAVWGLLGGAVLGAGLTYRQYKPHTVFKGLALTVVFMFVGWKLINDPRLIYFSHPTDRPREELWAGLLFAAIAFLIYMQWKSNSTQAGIPLRFALWGAVGGGLGFGGGTLFLVYGPSLPVPQEWFGWWKAMEFFFGFLLGGSIGWCAWWYQDTLKNEEQHNIPVSSDLLSAIGLVLLVAVYFWAFPTVRQYLNAAEDPGFLIIVARNLFRPVYTFVFFGAACIALGMRSASTAWQVAITATFFHTVIDLNRNWERSNGFEVPLLAQAFIMIVAISAVAYATFRLQRKADAVPRLYMLALWLCYGMACIRSFVKKDLLFPDEGAVGGFSGWVENYPVLVSVHGTFTLAAIITAACIWKLAQEQDG